MNYIKPITYSVTYGKDELEDYVEECLDEGKFPTQAGWEEFVRNSFDCMLEECVRASSFDCKVENRNHINVDMIMEELRG